ncbi:hypothetical protein PRZ48_001944 [Zasmidium cellare]|uniref:Uncharacterized protein n=1 Tax=Zasmidium cellare TaxID=395010 RepID=A0ABR0F4G5_ZASCE|nr:hypothetical protein PRZ48_001944 [Zasmidium cellare]
MEASSFTDLFAPDSGLQQAMVLPPTICSKDALSVSGIVAGAVHECTPVLVNGSGLEAKQSWLKAAARIASENNNGRTLLAHTLIAGASAYFQLDDVLADFDIWSSLVFAGKEMPQDVGSLPPNAKATDRSAAKFELAFSYASNVRRFFSTGEGKIGLGPSMMQPSDQVVILHGGKTPFILRPVDFGHKLLGQCYVHGIMQGEAVQEQRSKLKFSLRFRLR